MSTTRSRIAALQRDLAELADAYDADEQPPRAAVVDLLSRALIDEIDSMPRPSSAGTRLAGSAGVWLASRTGLPRELVIPRAPRVKARR